jgi:alpha-N-arabinofuranosidase
VHISLVNIDPAKAISLHTILTGVKFTSVTGQILTSKKVTDINTFENPNNIRITSFSGAKKSGDELLVELPAQSIVMLELK